MVFSSCADVVEFVEYAFDSYKKIFVSDKNLVFSPLAFRVVHAILLQCAQGDTEKMMARHLFNINDVIDKKEILQSQLINLNRLSAHPTHFNVIAKFFITSFKSPSKRFETTLKKFDVRYKQVKFHKRRDEIVAYMDEWITRKTKGKLTKMLSMEQFFDVTSLMAVNSLYFKNSWYTPFTKDSVTNKMFTNFNGDLISMPFITDEDTYRISKDDNFDVLELPYSTETSLMFWILLPTQTDVSMFDLKDKINLNCLRQINDGFHSYTARIQIPIFDVTSDIDGRHIMPELYNKANLNVYGKNTSVEWTEIHQKMIFSVNTNGTEPSNASVVKTRSISGFHGMKNFKVNRPFMYLVLTSDKLEPIIVGHYVNAI